MRFPRSEPFPGDGGPPEGGSPAGYGAAILAAQVDLRALKEGQAIPGMSVAVAVEGEIVWTEAMGFADLEQSVRATPETRYRLGSVSKLFTAAIAARLAEKGVLDLDVPIQRYVPSFPEKQAPITARLLAGHLAGIRHYRTQTRSLRGSATARCSRGWRFSATIPF